MTNYTLYGGAQTSPVFNFWQRLGLLATGGLIGLVAASFVVYTQIQASVQPIVTQDSGNELPIVHALQQNGDLFVVCNASSADDLQTAGGYNVIQRTERVQP